MSLRHAVLSIAVLALALGPAATAAAQSATDAQEVTSVSPRYTTGGRPSHGNVQPGDGLKILLRYHDADNFYAVHVDRRDGGLRIQRKFSLPNGGDAYEALEGERPPRHDVVFDTERQVVASAVDRADGSVAIRLEVDGRVLHEAVDRGQTRGGAPLVGPARVGLRGDNTEFRLGRTIIHQAGADGRPSGTTRNTVRFDQPDGLLTNQREASVAHPVWRVTSGSLFFDAGSAWSGVPDDVYPDPESRYGTNSSTFRMISRRSDLADVAVELGLTNHGFVPDPARVTPPPSRTPTPYPTGTHEVATARHQGRSNAHVALAVSQRAFSRARAAVLVATDTEPAQVAAPTLAGHVGGPLLLSSRSSLHPDTAAELDRLRVGEVHLVGRFDAAVVRALRDRGMRVRHHQASTAEQLAADVARQVGGRHVYLTVTDRWQDAVAISGAAAANRSPVLLTAANGLTTATARALRDLGVTEVTVLGSDLAPQVLFDLREDGLQVRQAGYSRYSIARIAADEQLAAGSSPRTTWLAPGARPFHNLVGGVGAAAGSQVLVSVDGSDLGPTGDDDRILRGYESRHWIRAHRHQLRQLRPIGDARALADRVVAQVTAPQRTRIAGMDDIAGTAHTHAIVWLLDEGIAGGFGDATYRPSRAVSRAQMATFLTNALDLTPATPPFRDATGNAHARAIGAVAEAGIAGGYADDTFRPNAPVTRGQMATFLRNALG